MLASRNYPPSAGLTPFIARHYVFASDVPGYELADFSLPDTALLCIVQQGEWVTQRPIGNWVIASDIHFFGPASRCLPVRVKAPFQLVGISFRPSGWRALFDRPASEFADLMLPIDEVWPGGNRRLRETICDRSNPLDVIRALEDETVHQLNRIGSWQVDEDMRTFEHIAQTDSTRQVKDVAAELGLSPRQLERHCLHCFGHSPKLVLRRSRFLDMATVLRGLAKPSEEQLAELRYFDQSHRNREFKQFINMTPQQFVQTATPLFTPTLQVRLMRKSGANIS
ncbi:AraC family transcriptional regulator [Rhizorhapis sp.]|uniref:AraC family transcriptional regulator n=1 Tax=Rhizorhapis sp. TaxID=1968842 RepID=UPI002B4A82B5|nr:AraC family transcriptional regulator [Rhizorhapis sp.]HKR16922.1 AraC family transcriptional regulator [Rhizorhapis sp.]